MQITSVDRRTTLGIERANPKDPHGGYVLLVEVQRPIARFFGENERVHFLKVCEFRPAFESFLRLREGSVMLDATEDCRLEFFRSNSKGDVGVRYKVSKYIYEGDPIQVCPVVISGMFKLDGEFVDQMAAQLLELLDA